MCALKFAFYFWLILYSHLPYRSGSRCCLWIEFLSFNAYDSQQVCWRLLRARIVLHLAFVVWRHVVCTLVCLFAMKLLLCCLTSKLAYIFACAFGKVARTFWEFRKNYTCICHSIWGNLYICIYICIYNIWWLWDRKI